MPYALNFILSEQKGLLTPMPPNLTMYLNLPCFSMGFFTCNAHWKAIPFVGQRALKNEL